MTDTELANRQRDKRLRKRMLVVLHGARLSARGGLNARVMADVVNATKPQDQGFESDDHCLILIRDMRDKGYIQEELLQRRRGQLFSIDFVFVRIAAKGAALLNETIPVDPDVDDERIVNDE